LRSIALRPTYDAMSVPSPLPVSPTIEPFAVTPSRVVALDGSIRGEGEHVVAVEVPVQVSFADVPFAVMMLTPADLVDFAYGFGLTEGMIERAADIRAVTPGEAEDGLTLRIDLVGQKLHAHLARQRAMTGRTGCGVCGIDDLEALRRAKASDSVAPSVTVAAIGTALSTLDDRQVLNAKTRAVHAAAWADASGAIREVREDVGRHNALDKLIGALVRANVDPASGFIVITSRCSFEMVEKAATFGARTVIAISAPTSLAIARAKALDVTLIAIARRDTLTVFNGFDRVVSALPADRP
jgi:FdhD protein